MVNIVSEVYIYYFSALGGRNLHASVEGRTRARTFRSRFEVLCFKNLFFFFRSLRFLCLQTGQSLPAALSSEIGEARPYGGLSTAIQRPARPEGLRYPYIHKGEVFYKL